MPCKKVTVLMAVYNGLPYLEEAVESVLRQSCADFWFYIVDDGSSNGTAEYLATLDDPRVKVWHRRNQGLASSLNFALEHVDTPYVMRADADDICLPERMETQLDFLEKQLDLVACSCDIEFTLDGGPTGLYSHLPRRDSEIRRTLMSGGHALCHPGLMIRSCVFKELGGYVVSGVGEDWALFVGLVSAGNVENIPAVLYRYRLRGGSLSVRYAVEIQKEKKKALAPWVGRRPFHFVFPTALADLLYRQSLVLKIKKRGCAAALFVLVAGSLSPVRAVKKVCREAKAKSR